MAEAEFQKNVLDELKSIKSKLGRLERRAVNMDLVLTDDDLDAIAEAKKDLKAGKLKRL